MLDRSAPPCWTDEEVTDPAVWNQSCRRRPSRKEVQPSAALDASPRIPVQQWRGKGGDETLKQGARIKGVEPPFADPTL